MSTSNEDWQTTKTTVLERTQYMFNNPLMSDVQFTCGESSTRKFYAHKYVLATSSPVFYTMFYGSLPDTKTDISLNDIDEASLEAFLRFIYTDELRLDSNGESTIERAFMVIYISKKYMVPSLAKKCVEVIKKLVTPENAVTVLEQALHFGQENLEAHCLDIVDENTDAMITSESFNEIRQEVLTSLLKRSLKISDVKLFEAVVRWSDHQCRKTGLDITGENRRRVLGDAVQYLCFLSMSHQEFASNVVKSGILTDKESVCVFVNLSGCEIDNASVTARTDPASERKLFRFPLRSEVKLEFEACYGSYNRSDNPLKFSTRKRIYLHGIRVLGSPGQRQRQISLEVEGAPGGTVSVKGTYTPDENRGICGFDVMLPKPLYIDPSVKITMKIQGPDKYARTKPLSGQRSFEGVTLQFVDSYDDRRIYEIIIST